MVGGETSILHRLESIAFADGREREWNEQLDAMKRDGAFTSSGVEGAFHYATGRTDHKQAASVYGLIAYKMGWLDRNGEFPVQRVLASSEFDQLMQSLDSDFYDNERTNSQVIDSFGPPSLRWGTNDYYPCTLLYIDDSPEIRFCYFDCWAEWKLDAQGVSIPMKYGEKPIVTNTRTPADVFVNQFEFTSFGKRLTTQTAK